MRIQKSLNRFSSALAAFFTRGARSHMRNITERESAQRIAMLERQRDAEKKRGDDAMNMAVEWNLAALRNYPQGWAYDGTNPALVIENIRRFYDREWAVQFMQRPGVQNGLKGIEEMEAGR